MKKLIFLLVSISLMSCHKKEIKLPKIAIQGIDSIIYNHSEVWMFYSLKNKDTIAQINRKNTISSTHWIYNIDKRLPLKSFIAELNKLMYKHHNSMHAKKGTHDYFSYANPKSKKLSLFAFDEFDFIYSSQNNTDLLDSINRRKTITFLKDKIKFKGNYYLYNQTKSLIDTLNLTSQNLVNLKFNETVNFEQFLNSIILINNFKKDSIKLNKKIYVFAKKGQNYKND